MSSTTGHRGRLGNQIVRNIAVSVIAKKHNLYVDYYNYNLIKNIGIDLFIGTNKYNNTIELNDNNYFEILEKEQLNNINPNNSYFQTKKITDMIFSYLNSELIMNNIINKNKHRERYNNNNDCFIHIRLGDVSRYNPGFNYYDNILSKLNVNNIYIATDSQSDNIIVNLKQTYKNIIMMNDDLADIFIFGSTCKYVILSYGTFSAMIGYISFYSVVYYLNFNEKIAWDWNAGDECDMFRNHSNKIGDWIEIKTN